MKKVLKHEEEKRQALGLQWTDLELRVSYQPPQPLREVPQAEWPIPPDFVPPRYLRAVFAQTLDTSEGKRAAYCYVLAERLRSQSPSIPQPQQSSRTKSGTDQDTHFIGDLRTAMSEFLGSFQPQQLVVPKSPDLGPQRRLETLNYDQDAEGRPYDPAIKVFLYRSQTHHVALVYLIPRGVQHSTFLDAIFMSLETLTARP